MTIELADMAAFAKVVEKGSFTAAAADLTVTPSAISKLVARLEQHLGVRLMTRTTRKLVLTPEGELYLSHALRILREIALAEDEVTASASEPRGRLHINASTAFVNNALMPALPAFLERYPVIECEISASDRVSDLASENIDVAIRLGPVRDETLVVRRLTDAHRVICASPDYLRRFGTPHTPHALANHACLFVATAPHLANWPFVIDGTPTTVRVGSRVRADNSEALLRLALAGYGVLRSADIVVVDAIRKGALVPLLQGTHQVEPVPVSAVFLPGRQRSRAVRVLIDFLVERFAGASWRAGIAKP